MARLLLLAVVAIAVGLFVYWFKNTPPKRVAETLRKVALWGAVALLILAAATGRLNPLFGLLGALLPAIVRVAQLAQLLPAIQRLLRSLGVSGGVGGTFGGSQSGSVGGSGSSAKVSSIRTRYLEMRLDHATGAMEGQVLEGPFAGRPLRDLDLDAMLRMLELYRESESQSASLLETYLDRERDPNWRDRDHGGATGQTSASGGPMTESEACSILGLKPGSGADAVRDAHRRLMQKLHPDRGGSDYLAAKINEAKRVLLKDQA